MSDVLGDHEVPPRVAPVSVGRDPLLYDGPPGRIDCSERASVPSFFPHDTPLDLRGLMNLPAFPFRKAPSGMGFKPA
jgi:hypothetical protein